MLKIVEHASSNYAPRTHHNASASDLTVAFAVDFSTAGEKLTKRAAKEKYLAIALSTEPTRAVSMLLQAIDARSAKVLNVAGNGIHTLSKHGWTQDKVNRYLFEVLHQVHHQRPFRAVISGGQTGVDLAGLAAGYAIGIEVVATLPRGYLQRGEDNVDRRHSQDEIRHQIEDGAVALFAART